MQALLIVNFIIHETNSENHFNLEAQQSELDKVNW